MDDHIAFLALGLGNGAVYAALGIALVMTFRSSGVVNFGTGAIALYIAYTFAYLRKGELLVPIPGLPKTVSLGGPLGVGPAMAISLVIAAVFGALLYAVVFRPLRHASAVAKAVASLGVMLVVQDVLAQRVGTKPVSLKPIFASGTVSLGDANIPVDRLILAGVIVAIALALGAVYRFTRFGLATRAAAETERGAVLSGLSPDRIALGNWAIATMVAGVSGILIAPIVPLVPLAYTLFIVPALAVAFAGNFSSLTVTVLAGLAVGALQGEVTNLQVSVDWFPKTGMSELIPLVLVLGVLLLRGTTLPTRGAVVYRSLGRSPRPRMIGVAALAWGVVGVVAILVTSGNVRAALIVSFILAVIALSQVVVTGFAGQVSLAQLTLAGVSAFLLSRFGADLGLPFPLAPFAAAAVTAVIGVVFGLPALRTRSLPLMVATLTLAVFLDAFWFQNSKYNGGLTGSPIESPTLFGVDLGIGVGQTYPRVAFALVCLVVLVAVAVGVALLRRGRLGAAMLAVRANERAAAAAGVNVQRTKLVAFGIGAFVAGLGGALLGYQQTLASAPTYSVFAGLGLFAVVYVAGITSVTGAVLAGLLGAGGFVFTVLNDTFDMGAYYASISGLLLIATLIWYPDGLAGRFHDLAARIPVREWTGPKRPARAAASPDVAGAAGAAVVSSGAAGAVAGSHGVAGAVAVSPGAAVGSPDVAGEAASPHGVGVSGAAAVSPDVAGPAAGSPHVAGHAVVSPHVAHARTPATEHVLTADRVSVRYGGVVAVDEVSLSVRPGEILGLIGPNGAGKTTLIDALSGFATATGSVALDGARLGHLPPDRRSRSGLGRSFQGIELYDDLTVRENVAVGLAAAGDRDEDTVLSGVFDLLDLTAVADRPVQTLSQGQRQLVGVARVLAGVPMVALLDEPAAGLDTEESRWLGTQLRAVRDAGTALVLVDHDMELVWNICDRVVVLDLGKVVAEGTPVEVRADPRVIEAYLGRPTTEAIS
ncbi:branched-chain amino acid ABC transporter permease/ATP-binding protein [Nocardia bovistercoris]|uniref:branched-chain amino acid ABC transporter permease/ATP-binding protein n=1 Tax=Nocardia bovistercoris TaxID=2785916 RepID=UPI001E4B0579|nr:branched-chain amino acid ABC transporter permease/ATP-binding protein [Nocardia bovistercoris]